MTYEMYLRQRGAIVHRQFFEADNDGAADAVAGAVFHSSAAHWDSYDLWAGTRLVGGPVAERLDGLDGHIELMAVAIEETMQRLARFAEDQELTARIKEIHSRRRRPI